MQVSTKWRIWLYFCAAVTAPFLMRNLYQIAYNPPVLQERLSSLRPISADGEDRATFSDGPSLQLVEVRAAVPGGYAGWPPRKNTLPETAPSHKFTGSDGQYPGQVPEGMRAYRLMVKLGNVPSGLLQTVVLTRASDIKSGGYSRTLWDSSGERYMTRWVVRPEADTSADVYAGMAIVPDRRTIAQFPVRGRLGISYGTKVRWLTTPGPSDRSVSVSIPAAYRPLFASQYYLEVFRIDAAGNTRLYSPHPNSHHTVSILPDTDRLVVKLPDRDRAADDTRAIRVTLTPYRWVKFPEVPLVSPVNAGEAQLKPFPIAPNVEQVRQSLTGRSGDTAFYEVAYAKREGLSHPQVARYVSDSVVITHTTIPLHYRASPAAPNETFFYAYLPRIWWKNESQMRLKVTTVTGEEIEAIPRSGYLEGSDDFRMTWVVRDLPPHRVESVQFGLAH